MHTSATSMCSTNTSTDDRGTCTGVTALVRDLLQSRRTDWKAPKVATKVRTYQVRLYPSRVLAEGTTVVQLTSATLFPATLLGASSEGELREQIQGFVDEAGEPPAVEEHRPGTPCWTVGVNPFKGERKPNGFDSWFQHSRGEFFPTTNGGK